jgi:hypothetical protein
MRGLLEQLGRNPDFVAVALICAALVPMPKIANLPVPAPERPAVVWNEAFAPRVRIEAPGVRIEAPKVRIEAMRQALKAQEQALILMEQLRAERAARDREGNRDHEENE